MTQQQRRQSPLFSIIMTGVLLSSLLLLLSLLVSMMNLPSSSLFVSAASRTKSRSLTVHTVTVTQTLSRSATATRTASYSLSSSPSGGSPSLSNSLSSTSSGSFSDSQLTPSLSATLFSRSKSHTVSKSLSESLSASPSASPSVSASASLSASTSLSASQSTSSSWSASETFDSSTYSRSRSPPPTRTQSFSKTLSRSRSLSDTDSPSPSPSNSLSSSNSLSQSASQSTSGSNSVSTSNTETYSGTLTPPPTPTKTFSRSLSRSRSLSSSDSNTQSPSQSLSFSHSISASPSNTASSSHTLSDTLSETDTAKTYSGTPTSDGTESKVGTKSQFTFTFSKSPSETNTLSQTPSQTLSGDSASISFSDNLTVSRNTLSLSRRSESDTGTDDETVSRNTETFSRNLTKSRNTMTESESHELTITGNTESFSHSATLSRSLSPPITESDSLSFSASLSISFSLEPTPSPSLSFTASLTPTVSLEPTHSDTVSKSVPSISLSESMPLTTSAMPPTTSPVPTDTRTLMTECPPNCGKGVCSNTYPYYCVCFAAERLGFWAKEKTLEGTCDRCRPGYYGPDCNLQCPGGSCAICGGHGTCDEGVTGTGVCTCFNNSINGYWTGTSCSSCYPKIYGEKCLRTCPCVRGTCDAGRYGSGRCDCDKPIRTGYTGDRCEECDPSQRRDCQATLSCPNDCSGHGTCLKVNDVGVCDCAPLYGSIDCSNRCPEDPNNGQLCYGHGWCNQGNTGTGLCVCNFTNFMPENCSQCVHGYWGATCQNPCFPNSSMPCNGNGQCNWMTGQCQCHPGFGDTGCSTACPTSTPGLVCSGHGSCSTLGFCQCDNDATKGYFEGAGCDRCNNRYWGEECKTPCGVWPTTGGGGVCNSQGTCDSVTGRCNCTNNYCGELCEVLFDPDGVCRSCPQPNLYGPTCAQNCLCENGRCSNGRAGDGSCTCNNGWAGTYCNETCIGGAVTICSGHGNCNPSNALCECQAGYSGAGCNNSCPILDCSGHGTCSDGIDGSGNCSCVDGWVFNETGCKDECLCINGGYCEYPSLNCTCVGNFTGDRCQNCKPGLAGVACDQVCGGTTVGTECVCKPGFGGPTCDDPCPVSDMGICSGAANGKCSAVTAKCECNPGFYGPSCRCWDSFCQVTNLRTKCNNVTGQCECQDNRDKSDPSCDTCRAGLYGVECNLECSCNNKGSCDKPTGIQCTCFANDVEGNWGGSTCDVCASGFMGSGCLQKSVAVTTLSPIFINTPGSVTNYWSVFDPRTQLYYTSGSNSRAFVFNLSANLPQLQTAATNNMQCDTDHHQRWAAGVSTRVWEDPNDKEKWIYLMEGNATCDQVARIQRGFKNNTVYRSRNTVVGSITPDVIRLSILIPDLNGFCFVVDSGSWQLGCRRLSDNSTNLIPRTVTFDPVSDLLWIPNRQELLMLGAISNPASCGFYFTGIDALGPYTWEGNLQTQMQGQDPRVDCRVIDQAVYVKELNTVIFGAMSIQGVFLSGVDFNTNIVIRAEIVSPLQQLRCTALIFHSPTKVGLSTFTNTLIKFRAFYPNDDKSQTLRVLPYGQQQIGTSLVQIRGFDLFEAQRMVLAVRRSYPGVQVLRFLLVEVTEVHPTLADSRGGTVVTVTGNSFSSSAPNPVCRFGSYTAVPAIILNERNITCVVPASESAEECEVNFVEVSLNNFSFTANQVELDRPNEPIVVAANPPRVTQGTSNDVTITGRGFTITGREKISVLSCKFFYSANAIANETASTHVVVPATFVNPTTIICHIGTSNVITSAGSGISVSLDGQLFSTSHAPFQVIGPGHSIKCTTTNAPAQNSEFQVELTNGSLPVTAFADPITVSVRDIKDNHVTYLDPVNRSAIVLIPFALLSKYSPQNKIYPIVNGTVNVSDMSLTLPPVGVTPAAIRVGIWSCTFAFRISAGRLAALRIKIQPLSSADLLLPTALLPQTTEVELVDDGGNVIQDLENIELNVSLIQVSRPNNTNISSSSSTYESTPDIRVLNVTRDLNRITARDTGVAAFAPIILPIVFGSYYQLRFSVIVNPNINVTTVVFTPGCPRNQFQIFGRSQCEDCPFQQATCNGSHILLAKPGYWRTDPNSLEFYRCPVEAACLAASEFTGCAEGYGGMLCNDCDQGYGKDFSGKCQFCGNLAGDLITLLLAVLGIFAIFGVLTLLYVQNCTFDHTASGQIATTLQLSMTMYQTLSLLSFISIAWPSVMFQLLAGLETFLDFRIFNFLSSDCFFRRVGIDTSAIFLFYGGMILFAVGIPMTVRPLVKRFPNVFMTPDAVEARNEWLASPMAKVQYATIEKFGKDANPINYLKQHQPKAILLNALQVVFFFGIQPALRSAFEVLPCVYITGDNGFQKEVMLNDVRVDCDSGAYLTFKIIAITMVVVYALIVPFIYGLGAAYYRFRYFDTYYKSYMGFSACGMTDDLWYWIPTILLRKIWLVIIVSFLDAPINLYFFVWSMMGFAWFAFSRTPYRNEKHIFLENVCNLNVIITGNLAMTIYVLDSPDGLTVQILQAIALMINLGVVLLLMYDLGKQLLMKTLLARKQNKSLADIQKGDHTAFDEDEFAQELEEQFSKNDAKRRKNKKNKNKNKNNNDGESSDDDEVYDYGSGVYNLDDSSPASNENGGDGDDDDEEDEYEDDDEENASVDMSVTGGKTVAFIPANSRKGKKQKKNDNSRDQTKDFIEEFAKGNNNNNNKKESNTEKSSKSDKNSQSANRMAYKSWYEPAAAAREPQDGALGALDDWFGGASEYDQQQNNGHGAGGGGIRTVNSIALDYSVANALDNLEMVDEDLMMSNTMTTSQSASSPFATSKSRSAAAPSAAAASSFTGGGAVTQAELDAAENENNSSNSNDTNNTEQQLIDEEELMHALNDVGTSIQKERAKMKAMLDMKKGPTTAAASSSPPDPLQQQQQQQQQKKKKNGVQRGGLSEEDYEKEMEEIRQQKRRVQDLHNHHVSPLETVRQFSSNGNNNNNNSGRLSVNVERFDDDGKVEAVTAENSIVSGRGINNEHKQKKRNNNAGGNVFLMSNNSNDNDDQDQQGNYDQGTYDANNNNDDDQQQQQYNPYDDEESVVDPITGQIRQPANKKKKNKNGDQQPDDSTLTLGSINASAFDW